MVDAPVESLPTELRILILQRCLDLSTLRSIVHASPVYHQTYLSIRHDLLLAMLDRNYDGLVDISDAITAIRSRGLYACFPSNKEKILALLDCRRRSEEICRLRLPSAPDAPQQPKDVDEILALLKLHEIAMYFLNDYSHHPVRPKWIDPTKWEEEILPLKLSKIEKIRFLRALYRHQILANIFGPRDNPVNESPRWGELNTWLDEKIFAHEEAWGVFLGTLDPWEIGELGCVWEYLRDKYRAPYNEIAQDMQQYPTKSGSVTIPDPPRGNLALDGDDLHADDESIEALAAIGPVFCFKFLHQATYRGRRDMVLANYHRTVYCLPNMHVMASEALPLLYPADRFNFGYDYQGFRDLVATLPPWQQPNIAFQWYFVGIIEEEDGCAVFETYYDLKTPHIERWAYAIWDEKRLIEWNAPQNYDDAIDAS
ncbi:hypothetical protein FE257_007114 [Aspergillus nanangensis]|uniref:F-box domain-containing protein n=1 Tax=Aspergillus nanangensis TaxID=2582783 RepID=A0AAD4CN95_ASPNN|nr:hypothetical protein FE257_007114 [Aspergillus nanangensis]